MMELPNIVSCEEWNAARERLLVTEKELTRARDQLSEARRRLPMVRMEKRNLFEGSDGPATLLDMFEGRKQLIVYHFMFGPDWEEGCPSCSFLVDSIGHLSHLHAANTTLALVSRASLTTLETYKRRMDWNVPWYSSFESDFNFDFNVSRGQDEQPGISVFLRDGDDVYHTYSTYARGGEILINTFNYLDLTPLGRQEEAGIMNWVRRHDQYERSVVEPVTAY